MKTFLMPIVLTSLLFMSVADFLPDSPLRLGFVRNAEAIIGMPRTPCLSRRRGAPFDV